jgi:hypothetical protein
MGILRGVEQIFELIYEEGLKEWLDETKYLDALEELNVSLDRNEITEDEYEEKEAEILKQLREVRNFKKKMIDKE